MWYITSVYVFNYKKRILHRKIVVINQKYFDSSFIRNYKDTNDNYTQSNYITNMITVIVLFIIIFFFLLHFHNFNQYITFYSIKELNYRCCIDLKLQYFLKWPSDCCCYYVVCYRLDNKINHFGWFIILYNHFIIIKLINKLL